MAPSPDSKDTNKDKDKDKKKDKDKSPPAPPSKSDSPPSSPPTKSPSKSDSSAPPPSNPSPSPPEKSPPPPSSPSPSPPPSPGSSPPSPPSKEDSPSPPQKSSPSPPPPASKGSPPTPSPPPEQDSPTPSPPSSSESSPPESSSPSKSPPPSNGSPQINNSPPSSSSSSPSSTSSLSSSSSSSPPPSPSSSSSSSPPPPPFPSPSSSNSSFSPPAPISPSSSPPSSDSSPSPPSDTDSSTTSWSMPISPSVSNSRAPNLTVNSIVNSPNHPPDQAARFGIAFGIVAAVLIVGFILAILFVHRRRKKRNGYNSMYMVPSAFASSPDAGSSFAKLSPNNGGDFIHPSPDAGIGNSKTWFSYEELATATDGFDSKHVIGTGGFGCVYKGFLQDGKEVAIKKLKEKSGQGDREFRAEVEIISRVHHRHLVSLVGYCIIDEQRLLVYEFVPNNTLYYHLHAANKPPMNWALRVRVACGSARGIAYLHEDCNPRIIHRDIKSANILLTNSFEAKVADFGLAKLAQELESNTHVSTRVMGTFGYMAPEYATSGKLTEKSDVFSFGVVLLELITGRKPVDDSRPLGDESLVEWARPLMSEALDTQNFDQLADSRLERNYDRGEMFRMIEAAAACVRHSASKRPRMSQVVRALDTMGDLSNGIRPGESEIMDSREQSVQIKMFQRMTFDSQDYSPENYNSQSSWTSRDTTGSAGVQSGGWSGQT